MKIYLVGGAVRDAYLNRPVTERDWVVVGATPQQMLDLGYKQVGKDFPVFLHPHNKEEYALARTERKTGSGYTGFSCYAAADVSLEQDLLRRDLTINAMAQDPQGQLIDPYGGLNDLNARVLRHVSPAFAEDPLRILRVARFAARYHHLGFKLAAETRSLMYRMVKNGEVNHLVAERVWQEWDRSLAEVNPEVFIQILRDCGALRYLLPELDILFGIPNPPYWHPEIDTGVHSLMALRHAATTSDSRKIRFAALVHDLGKGQSPTSQWPSHRGHDAAGVPIINALAKRLHIPKDYQQLAELTSRYHIVIHKAYELNPSTLVKLLRALDAFRRPQRFEEVLQVCTADACGRKDRVAHEYPPRQYLMDILQKCQQISVAAIQQRGFSGPQIKAELHRLRVELVANQFF